LIVEISGLCRENVTVTRDRVTLRGVDPQSDGIEAVENSEITDAALWVRGGNLVTVENLKLTGGTAGLLATDANLPNLRLKNCRLVGNNIYGLELENSLVEAEDTTFEAGTNASAGVFAASRLGCLRCTFPTGSSGSTTSVLNFAASRLVFSQSALTGSINSDDSLVVISDSSISASAPNAVSLNAANHSNVGLTRVQVTGPMRFFQGSTATLFGVTQVLLSSPPNVVEDNAFVRVGDAPPVTGGPPSIPSNVRNFNVRNFSNFMLLQTSTLNGNLSCSFGADAICSTPTNVSGSSTCGQCPKP
jgi:hypothetical protein